MPSNIEGAQHYTIADWPQLRDEIADVSIQEREARDAALAQGIAARVRPAETHTVAQTQRLVEQLSELRKDVAETAAWLRHVTDWGLERSEATLSDWEAQEARAAQCRAKFARLIGHAKHAQQALADPLAYLAQLESRFPPLRSPLPPCLCTPVSESGR